MRYNLIKNKIGLRQLLPALFLGLIAACSIEGAVEVDDQDESRRVRPDVVISRAGALGLYYTSMDQLRNAVSEQSWRVGIFTDELTNSLANPRWIVGDARISARPQNGLSHRLLAGTVYDLLHSSRIHAAHAREVSVQLNDSSLKAITAGAYAIEGYSILMLAENYCSGIPLTDVSLDGDVVYGRSLTTGTLLDIAIGKFDSSLLVVHDSANIKALARIGKARAYLGLGDYDKAVEAVSEVELDDGFYLRYTESIAPNLTTSTAQFWAYQPLSGSALRDQVEVVNREGQNGMVWFTDPKDIDPRVPVTTSVINDTVSFPEIVRQLKFTSGTLSFPLARGIEAYMVRAEQALSHGRPDWIDHLNGARATVGLPALNDPGTHESRVDILFQERAFWFYLEGIRLADFRRLVRQYGNSAYNVYPVGAYTRNKGEVPAYGDAWVLGIPVSEDENNYKYEGCLNERP